MATITGTGDDDVLIGTSGDDTISGLGGNDFIVSAGGNDALYGGDGADVIVSNGGVDTVDGGAGVDVWVGDYSLASANLVFTPGAAGSWTLSNGTTLANIERVEIIAGSGDDSLSGGAGNDTLEGGGGNDTLDGGKGSNTAAYTNAAAGVTVSLAIAGAQDTGGAGVDTLKHFVDLAGSRFDDVLTGDTHANTLIGAAGDDSLYGGGGNDVLVGGPGNDLLDGGAGINTASYAGAAAGVHVSLSAAGAQDTGGDGVDTLVNIQNLLGSNFDDVLEGNAGNNVLNGGKGVDTVSYADATAGVTVNLSLGTAQNTIGAGADTLKNFANLTGSDFDDNLTGSAGKNVIDGGAGDDSITGGRGADTLTGGPGADHFIYLNTGDSPAAGKGQDVITDFSSAQGDKIDLSLIDADTGTSGDQAFTLVGAFTHAAGQLIEIAKTGGFMVEGDVNGDGHADFAIFVNGAAPGAGDFIL